MAIKKSELYSSLWASCDELRGGMDASQYKDYVLVMLFVKYISDKFVGQFSPPVKIPKGATFADMVALKGKPTIGDDINKKIIIPLRDANKLTGMPDFNDPDKLGSGKEMVEKLTNLIAIFESKDLDFSKNRADGDDILGDAYEYLMRHFASESGKSKGQFYTPAEVSRILARVIDIEKIDSRGYSVYDPTCGSGSLLLKVADEAGEHVSLYGQEKDATTSGLARMNMILHNNPTAQIRQGNTLANPLFTEGDSLKTFDFVVANPPFSDKRWGSGVDAEEDPHYRFQSYGVPPAKNGDYAYLLHIIRSLKSHGKGACILPHGVLFRGNAEATIRQSLVERGYIKGIIGLPANLFYGTGIPACVIVIDKEGAAARKGIFMVDAGKGFIKDGNKNRLREMDIHKIVDVFNKQIAIDGYSRMVSYDEIRKNEFNLNIPRYIDSSVAEDIQDIDAHLHGDIPKVDIDALHHYWQVFPTLKTTLFATAARSENYYTLQVSIEALKPTIYEHTEFVAYIKAMNQVFSGWKTATQTYLKQQDDGCKPKAMIEEISESLLSAYTGKPLLDKYDVYQHLMNYWADTMQDDCYLISADGWEAKTYQIVEVKKGKEVFKGWTCDLIPKYLVINRYFAEEQAAIDQLIAHKEQLESQLETLQEEHSGEDGALNDVGSKAEAAAALMEYQELAWAALDAATHQEYTVLQKRLETTIDDFNELKNDSFLDALKNSKGTITAKAVKDRLKRTEDREETDILNEFLTTEATIKEWRKTCRLLWSDALTLIDRTIYPDNEDRDNLKEIVVLNRYLELLEDIAAQKKAIKEAEKKLDDALYAHYPELTEDEIKQLVVDDKWLMTIDRDVHTEMDRISQRLTQRIKELADRYETSLPQFNQRVVRLEKAVGKHLMKMGFVWN
ncbi:type I restriction-modification system subunit M [Endozoicomonas acroporae]|uniref:type I restriction-modification system subunit M n=1 Tax=Endozoicomonas acroporae TaxID=1701104 RepID=UPI003D796FF0